jgi:hypothetical protein
MAIHCQTRLTANPLWGMMELLSGDLWQIFRL